MKIRSIKTNNHKKAFEVRTYKDTYDFPYAKLDLRPTSDSKIEAVYIDSDLGDEAFTYVLMSGEEDSIHIDRVLEYNQDPAYMRDLLLYKLTIETKKLVKASDLSKREISRRLGTSATQLYRLLDEENYRKSIDQVFKLLSILDCRIDFQVGTPTEKKAQAVSEAKPTLELVMVG